MEASRLGHRQIVEVLTGLMLGMFLAALDQTIVTAAIRTIGDDLHGLSVQAWVTTAYLITATISTPLYGKLSDIYGRKRFFLAAITIFVLGSAACSLATSMYMLAGFRAVQGLGAGGLFSLALAIVGDLVPVRERARYQGYFLAVFGAASVLGPVIGGFFAGADEILGIAGWRWVFLVNVPVGAVALVVVARVLRLTHVRRDHRIDWCGALTICLCLVPLLTVAEQGRSWGWTDGRSLACCLVGGIGLVAFLVVEARMREEALIPLRFFRDRTFSLTAAGGFVVGMGMFGGLALLPLYLQIVRDATPTESGLQLLPLTAGIMLGSLVSGRAISRTGRYRAFPMIGAGLMIGGLVLLHTIGVDTPFWRTGVFMGVFGLGLGFVLQPVTLAVQNAMPPADIGVATASSTFFRQMGATAGTAVFLSILFSSVGEKIGDAFRSAAGNPEFQRALAAGNPADRPIADAVRDGGLPATALDDTSFLTRVAPELARPVKAGFADAVDGIFLLAAVVLVLALLLFLFLPSVPLRERPASPAPHVEEDRVEKAVVSGRIDGPDGQPLAGATLTVTDFLGEQVARAVTGPDGAYRMELAGGGSFLLICAAEHHQPAVTQINVAAGEIRRVLALAGAGRGAGGTLAGTVMAASSGRPVPEASVLAVDQSGAVAGAATTGPDGRYEFRDLPPGSYTVTASGHAPVATRVELSGARTDHDITLGASVVQPA